MTTELDPDPRERPTREETARPTVRAFVREYGVRILMSILITILEEHDFPKSAASLERAQADYDAERLEGEGDG